MSETLCRTSDRPVRLVLGRDLARSLKRGHPWVFRDALRDPPEAERGAPAELADRQGRVVARGYYDGEGPLSFRACTTSAREVPDHAWAAARLDAAFALRETLFDRRDTTGFRLANGEGDGVPGLVLDLYDRTAVLKLDGPAAEAFWDAAGIARFAASRLGLERVYERRRTRGEVEGRTLFGPEPDGPIAFLESGLRFTADIVRGQKTGFFLDQRENRRRVRALARGRSVLNAFGYTGGFSVYAAAGGAESVTTVDVAAPALAVASDHLARNGLAALAHEAVAEDVFAFLERSAAASRTWDLAVLDPPSFAPNRKAAPQAEAAYRRLVALGARVTSPGGFLVACSCSSHVPIERFVQAVEDGIGDARRRGTVLGIHEQPDDHPTPLAFRDFRYLKAVFLRLDGT